VIVKKTTTEIRFEIVIDLVTVTVIVIVRGIDPVIIAVEIAPATEKAIRTTIIVRRVVQLSALSVPAIKRDFVETKCRTTAVDAIRFKRVAVDNAEAEITITIVTIEIFIRKVVVRAEAVGVHPVTDIVPPNRLGATTTVRGDIERRPIDRRSASAAAIILEFAKKKRRTNAADVQLFNLVARIVARAAITNLRATKKETY